MTKKNILFAIFLSIFVVLPLVATAAEPSVIEQDRVRITAHLLDVEEELVAADVSHLSADLKAERIRNIERLRVYREAGEFPRNTYIQGLRPVFIDSGERACAVGQLMIDSGWEEAARSISARENLQYLPKMESPEVLAWVEQSGLTAEEAARIQPSYRSCYDDCGCGNMPVCGDDGKTYVNPCFAYNCGGVERWYHGCCDGGDQIESSANEDYGFAHTGTQCPGDPNDDADRLCPASDGDRVIYEEDWVDAAEYQENQDGESCAMAAGSPAQSLIWLAFLAAGLVGIRRPSRAYGETSKIA